MSEQELPDSIEKALTCLRLEVAPAVVDGLRRVIADDWAKFEALFRVNQRDIKEMVERILGYGQCTDALNAVRRLTDRYVETERHVMQLIGMLDQCKGILLQHGDPFDGDDWQAVQDIRAAMAGSATKPLNKCPICNQVVRVVLGTHAIRPTGIEPCNGSGRLMGEE